MRWVKLSVRTNATALDAVSATMEALGTGGTIFEPGPVAVGYLPADDRFEPAWESLRSTLAEMPASGIDPAPADITLNFVEDADWANAWKDHYHPIAVTSRITIAPTWEDYTPRSGELLILLDPGMAFGTGGHATTRLCLQALEALVSGGETVADIGTGSGVLAIGAALLGAARVAAVDADPVAVRAALENVEVNGLSERIAVRTGDRLNGASGPYDLVIANILPNVVSNLAADAHRKLVPGGIYLDSGLTLPYEEDVRAALEEAGFAIEGRWEEDHWVALAARKARNSRGGQ
jgi:ribosomal protein L11 methyltransferase